MIIIGYPGIGKTTTAKRHDLLIDLDSSSFNVDGKKPKDWQYAYCQVAEHISNQNYIVFISSHKEVREYFKDKKSSEKVIIIAPDISLKDKWIKRVEDRYNKSKSDKDLRALTNVKNNFENNINDMMNDDCENIKFVSIKSINYDLIEIVAEVYNEI